MISWGSCGDGRGKRSARLMRTGCPRYFGCKRPLPVGHFGGSAPIRSVLKQRVFLKKPLTPGISSAIYTGRKLQWSGPTFIWPKSSSPKKHGGDSPRLPSHQSTSMAGHHTWSKVQRHQGANDANCGKSFSKLARELTFAALTESDSPNGIPRLTGGVCDEFFSPLFIQQEAARFLHSSAVTGRNQCGQHVMQSRQSSFEPPQG